MSAYCNECGNDTTGKEFCDECGAAVLSQAEPRGDAHDAQLKARPPALNPAAAIMTNPVPEYSQANGNYLTELSQELGGAWMAPEIRRGRAVPWKLIVGAAVALIVIAAGAVLLGSSSSMPSPAPEVAGTTPSPCLVADTAGGTSHGR